MNYKLSHNQNEVFTLPEMGCIPADPANTDYAAYLKWIGEGNIPQPADPQPEPVPVVDPVDKLKAFLAANPDVAAIL